MADDLDDFFNEIEEVEQEVVKDDEVVHDDKPLQEEPQPNEGHHQRDETEPSTPDEPPPKRLKSESAPPIRPRGVVVAAASSAVIRKPSPDQDTAKNNNTIHNSHGNSHITTFPIPNGTTNAINIPLGPSMLLPTHPPPPPPPPPQQLPLAASSNLPQQSSSSTSATNPNTINTSATTNKKPVKRAAAGKVWVDPTLEEWPENDFRIFCGNLDKSVTDQQLYDHYKKYVSLAKAKVVKDTKGISKGYGFVSFLQPLDCAKAIRETDQTWLGSRPIRVKRSDWKDRNLNQVLKQNKKQEKQRKRLGL